MKANYTDITVIIDRSGSMGHVVNDVIGAFNNFIDDQKKVDGEATLTLIQFDNIYTVNYEAVDIQSVKYLNMTTYQPRGTTALNDAVGKAITSTGKRLSNMAECDRPDKVIMIIQTDGEENSSTEYTSNCLNSMIKEQSDKYSWKFIFMGSDITTSETAKSMGISQANTVLYTNSSVGTRDVFNTLSSTVASYRLS